MPDPLVSVSIPEPEACKYNKLEIKSGKRNLQPGTYCGGLKVEGGAEITLLPGLHIMSGGGFILKNASIAGEGITVVLADKDAHIQWETSTIRLSAPKTGSYAGFVILGQRVETDNAITESTADLHGVVYMVHGAFDWENIGEPGITAKWTAWIVDGFSWRGSGTIRINFNLTESDIPYPQALRVIPRPNIGSGAPRLAGSW